MFKKSNKKEKELVEELLKKADALEQEHGDESVLYGDSTNETILIMDSTLEDIKRLFFFNDVICSNNERDYGAGALFYPEVLKKIGRAIGNFYIVPTSIHETLLVPEKDSVLTQQDLRDILNTENQLAVLNGEEELVFSDEIYKYSKKTKDILPVFA